jgi:RimJ/RimL family protein N-acetyltransferase
MSLDDTDDMYEYAKRADVTLYLTWSPHAEKAYTFQYLKYLQTRYRAGDFYDWAICDKESGKMMGYILFKRQDEGVYEMGWIYNRQFWRQGLTFESCKAVIDYAFTELKAHKIFAEAIDAVKSVGLMQKLGMQLEGIQRSQTRDNHGNWADLYFYGLLEDDWRKHGNQI